MFFSWNIELYNNYLNFCILWGWLSGCGGLFRPPWHHHWHPVTRIQWPAVIRRTHAHNDTVEACYTYRRTHKPLFLNNFNSFIECGGWWHNEKVKFWMQRMCHCVCATTCHNIAFSEISVAVKSTQVVRMQPYDNHFDAEWMGIKSIKRCHVFVADT